MNPIYSEIISGIATAAVLGLIALLWRWYREYRVKQLGALMGIIIEHKNAGLRNVPDPASWVKKAEELEQEAIRKAYQVSAASGLLIDWLGTIDPRDFTRSIDNQDQRRIVNRLITIISRLQDTLARHDR